MPKPLVLLVDDDKSFRAYVTLLLEDRGYAAEAVESGNRLLARLASGEKPSVILLDVLLKDSDGIEVMRRIMDDMHIRDVAIVYGMTELSGGSTQTSPGDTLEQRVATIGRAQPHMEVKIADPEGRAVPLGTQGEICFRGYMVMRRYWNGEAETRETIDPARWLHSGDLGTMDEDGYLTITGRSKDMVIRGGENIYPREVEEFLFSHPAVADVQVFGVPDDRFGEELCAWIRPRPGAAATEEEIRAFCRGRITHFKIPRYVRFVETFPMTVTGKVQKYVMREMMTKELASYAAPSNAPSSKVRS